MVGRPWQEPDGGFASTGRIDLHTAIDTEGRTDDRRGDFASVYGDWDALREELDGMRARHTPAPGAPARPRNGSRPSCAPGWRSPRPTRRRCSTRPTTTPRWR